MSQEHNRSWTTLWDRKNQRVLLLAGRSPGDMHWAFVTHDQTTSVTGKYDIWRAEGDIVFVEIRLDQNDRPLGFPDDLLDSNLLGSPTIWPKPELDSFIWWHPEPKKPLRRG